MNVSASRLKRIQGGDPLGHVFDAGDCIVRTEAPGREGVAARALERYQRLNLAALGVVETAAANDEVSLLAHKKYRITYPHEWTASMLKDAVLFHLRLLQGLDESDLTLKDALPENIVFHGTRPVFVDFYSILSCEELSREDWLVQEGEDPRQSVLKRMFFPYMLLPLLCHAAKHHQAARVLLGRLFCNNTMGREPGWDDVPGLTTRLDALGVGRLRVDKLIGGFASMPWKRRLAELTRLVEELDVRPVQSDYLNYYEEKGEAFDLSPNAAWQPKQHSVLACLEKIHPATVLDLGANPGWFSRLAVQGGAEVIAVDNDESCIDNVYAVAQAQSLPLISLLLPFDEMTHQDFAMGETGQPSPLPFHKSALERLDCDMVLCLGLFHHLTLGLGHKPDTVLTLLAQLARKALVLEFVELSDPKIVGEPSFFPHLADFSASSYHLDAIIQEARQHFGTVEALPSEPTRHILLLQR